MDVRNDKEYIKLLEQRNQMDFRDCHELSVYRKLFQNHLFKIHSLHNCLSFNITDALQCGLTRKNFGQ